MNRRTRGFTLVELLVVMAIVAILGSLLLPALCKAAVKARMTEELSAGRQLMLAVQLYSDDFGGAVFPGYVSDPGAVDDRGRLLGFPANARYPWRIVPYLSGSMPLIYSGRNRARLLELQSRNNHADYVYSVSVFPSLGINSFFIGGNQTEFPAAEANELFGPGTVPTKMSQVKSPSVLMSFLSARSALQGSKAHGYFQVTPPSLTRRRWASEFSSELAPADWGFVAPRFNRRAVAALLDGHAETFNPVQTQDMRHWCNTADRANYLLQLR